MVARRGFHHADDILVYLLRAPAAGDRLYHVLAGQYLVEVMLAEQLVPGAGRAAGYAGDRYRVEVEAQLPGERSLVRRKGREPGVVSRDGDSGRGSCFQGPVLVIRVEEFPAGLRDLAVPFHGEAEGRHIRQQIVEFGYAAALRVVGREYGHVRFVLQRGSSEGAQDALGAALYESAHALGVHALQLPDEFHRARHLLYQHVVNALRVLRKKVGGHIRQYRQVGGLYGYALEELAVGPHGGLDYSGMEGVGHGDLARLYAQVFEPLHGLLHGGGLSGYHGLQRAVLVGADDVAVYFFQFGFYLVAAPGYGGHFAGIGDLYGGHFFGAAGYGAQAVLESEDPRRGRGGVFAQAVAYGHVGLYAEFPEKAVHRYVRRHHGRLGQLRLLNGGFALRQFFLAFSGLGPQHIGQPHAYHFFKYDIRLVESRLHGGVLGGQVPHHVHVLRALAGEQQAHLGVVFAGLEGVYALQLEVQRRRGPGFFLGVRRQEGDLLCQVFRRLGHYGHAPGGLGLHLRGLREGGHRVGFGPF